MNEKLISDTLVKAILSCLEKEIDIPNEYMDAFIARTMLVVQKEDRKQISSLYPRLCDSVFNYFRGHQYNERSLQTNNAEDNSAAYLEPNNRAFVFKMGQLHACVTILNDVIRKLDESEMTITYKKYIAKYSKFFEAIANKPGIKHSELAEITGKSPSGLSQFVLKIQQFDLFTRTVVGREKYYYLTPKGLKLFDELVIEVLDESAKVAVASKLPTRADKLVRTTVSKQPVFFEEYYSYDEFIHLISMFSCFQSLPSTSDIYSKHLAKHFNNIVKWEPNISDFYKDQETYKLDAAVQQKYE